MNRSNVLFLLLAAILVAGCTRSNSANNSQIANPASTNCIDKGGTLDIRTASDGSQTGYCTLADQTVCEEWAYYRGECPKTDAQAGSGIANPASTSCIQKGGSLEILTDENGGQYGMCTLPDGTKCEEWAFFRGECPAK